MTALPRTRISCPRSCTSTRLGLPTTGRAQEHAQTTCVGPRAIDRRSAPDGNQAVRGTRGHDLRGEPRPFDVYRIEAAALDLRSPCGGRP